MARELSIVVTADTAAADRAFLQTEGVIQDLTAKLVALGHTTEEARAKAEQFAASYQKTSALKAAKQELDAVTQATEGAASAQGALVQAVGRLVGPAALGAGIKASLAFADNLKELSQQSGFSVQGIQTLGFTAQNAGSSFQAVANAANTLDNALSKGGDRITGMVGKLGFEVDALLALSPEERFRTVATAIGGLEDPAARAEAAMALFGRAGRDLLPMMQDLADGAETFAPRVSSTWVEHMARVNDATETAWGWMKNMGTWLLTFPIEQAMTAWDALVETMSNLTLVATGVVDGALPSVRGAGPNLGFLQGGRAFDPLNGQSMGFLERQLTQGAQAGIRAATRGGSAAGAAVVPVSPLEWRSRYTNAQAVWAAQQGIATPAFGFPGWAPSVLPSRPLALDGAAWNGSGMGMLRSAVPMNAPSAGGGGLSGFLSGRGGQWASAGLGLAASFLPGLNRGGSQVGAGVGSLLSGFESIASRLGGFTKFLGPLGAIAGGLVGNLAGRLFNSEGKQTNRARDSFIGENFGSVDNLRKAAEQAGFSVDRLLSTRRVKDFEAEVERLTAALEEHAAKRAEINSGILDTLGQLQGMGLDRDTFAPMLAALREAGQLSEDVWTAFQQMSTGVDFRKMDEAAERLGITDRNALGNAYGNQRTRASAESMTNDIDTLIRGGADIGGVLFGAREQLSKMAQDAMKFGTELPAQMQPWLEELARSGNLLDANGNKITDITNLRFGAKMETDFEKLIRTLNEFIQRLGQLPGQFNNANQSAQNLANTTAGINVPGAGDGGGAPQPGPGNGGEGGAGAGFDSGGVAGRTWRQPSLRDVIPAYLRPGEVVLTPEQARGGVRIGSLVVHSNTQNRAQFVRDVGEAVVSYYERRGKRVA